MVSDMIIDGMKGLGDNIYQRAFIKALGPIVFLETPWPELYADLPHVRCVKPETTLRTQGKNIARQTYWHPRPVGAPHRRVAYSGEGIYRGMKKTIGVDPAVMDLPDFGPSPVAGRYIVVRPVTVREEWRADARNPRPDYIAQAAAMARAEGFVVVSVADLADGREWALSPLPPADITYHAGELPVSQLLALVQGAVGVVGGVGWILPACIAARVPALVVFGGQGGFNAPEKITHPAMDLSRIALAVPDRLCPCTHRTHNCDKRIRNYDAIVTRWIKQLPALES